MTEESLEKHRGGRWDGFWRNLKEGHDFLKGKGTPPNVEVQDGKYVFDDD
jgi:hypothetical protein